MAFNNQNQFDRVSRHLKAYDRAYLRVVTATITFMGAASLTAGLSLVQLVG